MAEQSQRKQITLNDFLTEAEMKRCIELYRLHGSTGLFAKLVAEEIMQPNMARINTAIGQENDPHYLAYLVEYVMMQASTK